MLYFPKLALVGPAKGSFWRRVDTHGKYEIRADLVAAGMLVVVVL